MSEPLIAPEHRPLLELGRALIGEGYRFTTPTPLTHARVVARAREGRTLREIFGWNLPFDPATLGAPWTGWLEAAGALLLEPDGRMRSGVRFSSLEDTLLVHSGFPTGAADSVFFGPDTYRFARLLKHLPGRFGRAVDIGAGTGAGLLSIRDRCEHLHLVDLNPRALRYAAINAELNGARAEVHESNVLKALDGTFDLIVSNPPYLVDDAQRTYRHGGQLGIELPARIAAEALPRLAPGGALVLYTGTPIMEGRDLFREAVSEALRRFGGTFQYEEVDPDVFGEELERPAYAGVERIAAVALVARRAPGA
ncbi:MAG TPA: class I SAM-dependent methyltransferase [Myxococcaceae bacterium]|nr:class I SAM-dependent methyltransferase [Myxococcaceae bacterium]